MPSQLADSHRVAQQRLRQIVAAAVGSTWAGLPGYDKADAERFIEQTVPLVLAGQRQAAALTEAFLARFLARQPLGVDVDTLVGAAVRNGTSPGDVYHRPFVTLWSALATGTRWEDAVDQGLHRATSTVDTDLQLSSRATFQAVQEADEAIYGYRRVTSGSACNFCATVAGAYVKHATASPLHAHCSCSLEPLTAPHPRARWLPTGTDVKADEFAVHHHGELGAVLTDPAYSFAGPSVVK